MSRWEGVLIDADESIDAVAGIIEEIIGAGFRQDEDADLVVSFGRTAGAWLRNADSESASRVAWRQRQDGHVHREREGPDSGSREGALR